MPTGMGEEERFAAAVENGTTPASRGRGAGSSHSLAHELEIVALLRAGGQALGPEPAARDRAKRRLMAAFEQEFAHDSTYAGDDAGANALEATGPLQVLAPVALAERPRAPHRAGRHSAPEPDSVEEPEVVEEDVPELGNVRRLRTARKAAGARRGHSRAALVGAAAAAALVALAGTGTFASRGALPGDPMYGVKRVAESTSYALTFGEQAKARRHLEQAQRRLDEVEGMVARSRTAEASAPASVAPEPPDQELLQSTMQEFDTDTSEGSRLLLAGPTPPDTAQVDEVRTWATEQSERLADLRSTLPAPDRADESLALLDRLLGETDALSGVVCQPAEAVTGSETATADACASGSSSGPGLTGTEPVPTPEDGDRARARARASSTADSDDADEDADTDTTVDGSSDGDDDSARTPTTGSDSAGTDDRQQRDDRSGGSGGSSGSGGSGGSGDISVPLPLPAKVGLPSVGGLPGLSVGG